jgi:thiamine-phosphate diphosphorylase
LASKDKLTPYSWPPAPLLMLVSDRKRHGDRTIQEVFLPALRGGVNIVQLWEPDLPARDLLGEAEQLRKLAVGGIPMLIYDRADVAVAANADGVHLPADGLPIGAAKRASRGLMVGKAVRSVTEAVTAERAGADYVVVGPIFPSHYVEGGSLTGPGLVQRVKAKVRIPVFAAGGITAGNAHQAISAGADGVSVTSEIVEAEDPQQAARTLLDAMRSAWPTRPLQREALV